MRKPQQEADSRRSLERSHRLGLHKPMNEDREGAQFLGIYVSESILARYFNNVKKMPYNNPGFDFLCEKGYKIDAKSSTIRSDGCCAFTINRNKLADYFLCLAFDNRESLNPVKIWLIPGECVNMRKGIGMGLKRGTKYAKYEKPIDKVVEACNTMKEIGVV